MKRRPQGANTSIPIKTPALCMGAPNWEKDGVYIGRSSFKVPILSFITYITLDKSLNFLSAIIIIHENMKTISQGCCDTQIRQYT